MAERLTIKNSDNTYSQPTDTTFEMVFNKLGELEDIMEKYGIESVEELEDKIICYEENKDANLGLKLDIKKLEQDRDTWQKACELACDVILRFTDGCPCKADYFYQQVKKGKVN